jgi:hypothetical protein
MVPVKLLEMKSVVVHFEGKAFNPDHLHITLWMLEEDQLIRELKVGGVNQDIARKWVKIV